MGPAGRVFTVELTMMGREIGTKTEITTRGKVAQVHYFLPPMEE